MINYIPITIPPSFGKIFEYCRLDLFLQRHILSPNQYGVRSGFSTSMKLNAFYEEKTSWDILMQVSIQCDYSVISEGLSTVSIMYQSGQTPLFGIIEDSF